MTMKIAEALMQRADLQRRASELEKRLQECALIQEGDDPPDDPRELLSELRSVLVGLRVLLVAINRSNLRGTLPGGRSITEGLAQRDVWKAEITALRKLVEAAHPTGYRSNYRVTRSEVRFVPTVDVPSLHHELDQRQQDFRELNVQIQQANWATDLFET